MSLLRKYWSHPLTKGIDIDSPKTISVHREIILSKPFLRAVYQKWYSQFLPSVKATEHLRLPMVEIGCGASHLEFYIPDVIKTDVVAHSNINQVVDATKLPYGDRSLRALFVLNALHHFDYPEKFLSEAKRTLAPGGRLVITEPSGSPLQRFMIQNFHPYEFYDGNAKEWHNVVDGRLSKANNALPWIIFERDRKTFESRFPELQIISTQYHTVLMYYASGGLSYRTFLPSFTLPLLQWIDKLAGPIQTLGTEMTIVIEKR